MKLSFSERSTSKLSALVHTDFLWRRLSRVAALLCCLGVCLYFPTLFNDYFADDEIYLAFKNHMLRRLPWTELHQFFLKPGNPWEFLPLRDLGYWFDFRMYGENPMGFHFSNLVWYLASVLGAGWLFFELINLLRPSRREQSVALAFCGMAIFALHPAHIEAVAWVASRKDLMAGTLNLISAALLVKGVRSSWHCGYILTAFSLFIAACFSKAAGVTGVIFLSALVVSSWRLYPNSNLAKKCMVLLLPWIIVIICTIIHMEMADTTGIRIQNFPSAMVKLERASRILVVLIGFVVWPSSLGIYHDVFIIGGWHWLVSLFVVALFLGSFISICIRPRIWLLGVILVLSPLLVYLQIIPFTTWSMASERFVFVSIAGLSLIIIDIFGAIGRPKVVMGLLLYVSACYVALSWARIGEWEDSFSLWNAEFRRAPSFHNTIRDRVFYILLPSERYGEAEILLTNLERSYAEDVLKAIIQTERSYRQLQILRDKADSHLMKINEYCDSIARLRHSIANGHEEIKFEPDISYNNLIRSADGQLKQRYGNISLLCKD